MSCLKQAKSVESSGFFLLSKLVILLNEVKGTEACVVFQGAGWVPWDLVMYCWLLPHHAVIEEWYVIFQAALSVRLPSFNEQQLNKLARIF